MSSRRPLAGLLFLSLFATAAHALIDVPTSERRALETADLASSSGLALPVDTASLPLGDEQYLRAYRALEAVGWADPWGRRLDRDVGARADGKLHLETLVPELSLRTYVLGGTDERLLYHAGGEVLKKGFNGFLSASGFAAWGGHLGGAYELRLSGGADDLALYAKRLYLKGTLGKWSLKIGRDTVRLGPGYHGSLLVDDNSRPFDLWQVRTEEPLFLPWFLESLGGFRFTLFNAYLSDEDPSPSDPRYGTGTNAVENPNLMGMRLSYHPTTWLDVGVSRSILYGGEGRETYDSLRDWWELFTATRENVHEGESDRYDNDQYAAVDLTIRLPVLNGLGPLRAGKVYGEYAGTDFRANWKSDKGTGSWVPVSLASVSTLAGFYLSTGITELRAEYTKTNNSWYRHHVYGQGYTHQGLPIGHHVGGDARDTFVQVSRYFGPEWCARASFDWEERGLSLPDVEKRFEGGLRLESYRLQAWGVPLIGHVEGLGARVINPLDDLGTERRMEWYVGVGVQGKL